MQVKAKLSNLRVSPKKIRLVVDLVRGLDVAEAKKQLTFINKVVAKDILGLLNSAVANGVNNYGLNEDNLYIKSVIVGDGITIKRWRARAFGRAGMIRKRTGHINLILDEKVPTEGGKIKKQEAPKVVKAKDATVKQKESIDNKQNSVPDIKSKRGGKGFAKKVFQRKAG